MKEQALREQAIKEQVLREQALREQALKEQALREQAIKEQEMKEQAIKEQALREQAIKEQEMKERALKEQEMKEQALKEQTIKEQVIKEQAIMSNISATLPCITLDVDDMNEEYNSNDNFMNIFKDYSYDCTIEELNESFDVERINSDCFHHDKRSTQTNNVDQGITLESDVKESKVKESEVKMNALVSQDEQVKHHHHNHSLSNFMENTDTLGKTKEWKNAQKDFDDFSTIFQEKEHQQSYNENSRNEIIPLKKASSKVKVDKKPNNAPDKVESILFSEEPTSKKTTNRPKTSVPNSASMPSVSKDDKKSAKRTSKKKPSNELFGYGFFSLFK
ncbi:hypothetical protein TRFO_03783 [Tritrichomonas foetus]|uniref:Uncharacterized protein n=1 Tax=Tritrichomonas foetus TaxID=1144522 RepID=A0A1J4KLX7_9EUKA|nr:hypothetical protein TRFO_03783 [Tritrichomonas foetus]|eukprot:OHT12138.1 hypothetical protein TRFO_03783 [Tritrichomonas foetus]